MNWKLYTHITQIKQMKLYPIAKRNGRICEYCGAPMDLTIDEDGFLVFDCPDCMNTWTVLGERKHYV